MSAETPFSPLVKGATTTISFNIGTIIDLLSDGTYYVPDYQRDSSQWDVERKSLFIESLINNLTVPPLIVYPHDDPDTDRERVQIIDGQQRLTTIREFVTDGFALAPEDQVDYADNVAAIIQGKKFSQLSQPIQNQIKRYVLNLILLPKNLDSRPRLEIFRRINEAGVPLSSHDLRLAEFGAEKRVAFIRVAGLFDPTRDGAKRMIDAAAKFEVTYPWSDSNAQQAWMGWWGDTTQALGQASSQMYLYYTIARDRVNLKTLVESEKTQDRLKLRYDRTITSVLDLYCAQLQNEAKEEEAKILAPFETMEKWFRDFSTWFALIKTRRFLASLLVLPPKLRCSLRLPAKLGGRPLR